MKLLNKILVLLAGIAFLCTTHAIAQDTTKTMVTEGDNIIIIKKIEEGSNVIVDKQQYDIDEMSSDQIKDLEREMNIVINVQDGKVSVKAEERGENMDESMEEMEREVEEMERRMEEKEEEIEEKEEEMENEDEWAEIENDWWDDEDDKEKEELDNIKSRWLLLRLGFNSFVRDGDMPTVDDGTDPTELGVWNSKNWGLDIFQMRFNLINHYVNLKTGLGFDFNYYEFDNNVTLVDKTDDVMWTVSNNDLNRNNLYAGYVRIPLMLNFETNPRNSSRSFKVNAGVYGGLRMSSRLMQEYDNVELKVKDNYNLNDWTYGLTGSIGYGSFNLYANYSLVGLFQEDDNSGYALTPFNIGLEVFPF